MLLPKGKNMHCSIIKYLCFCVVAVYCSATNSFAACIDDLPIDPVQNQILESALIEKPLSPVTEWLIQRYIAVYGQVPMTSVATLPQKAPRFLISPDNSKLITVDGPTATIYRMSDLTPIATLRGHTDFITSIAISPDSTKIIIMSQDQTPKIWNIIDGSLIKSLPSLDWSLTDKVIVSPDNSKFVTLSGQVAKIWNMADGSFVADLECSSLARSAAISSDGLKIFCAFYNCVKEFNMTDGSLIKIYSDYRLHSIDSIELNQDGSRMVTKGYYVTIWDTVNDSVIATLKEIEGCNSRVTAIASTDSHIITGYHDGTVIIWDTSNGALLKTLNGGTEEISSIKISTCNQFVTFSYSLPTGKNALVKIWTLDNGALLATIPNKQSYVDVSSDGTFLVTSSRNWIINIWHMPLFSIPQQLKEVITKVKIEQLLVLEWLREVASKGKKINLKLHNPDPRVQCLMKYYRDQYEALPPLIKELVKDFVRL